MTAFGVTCGRGSGRNSNVPVDRHVLSSRDKFGMAAKCDCAAEMAYRG